MASMRRLSALSAVARDASRAAARVSRPPSGPSCSRWLSCTCCAPNQRPPSWSTASAPSPDAPPSHQRSPFPSFESLQRMKTPHLPLPPPLPWSPTSHQFLRHLQILSLALLGNDVDETWHIYEGLYPDLRQAIPDDVFVSLVAQQATGKAAETRGRLLDLMGVARSCEMDIEKFDKKTLLAIVKAIVHAPPHDPSWTPEAYEALDWLWNAALAREEGALRRAPLALRQDWLELMAYRYRNDVKKVRAALEELVENGGGSGITKAAARIILAKSKTLGEDELRESLRLAAWCVARDVTVQQRTISLLLTRIRLRVIADGGDGRGAARRAAEDLIGQLDAGGAVEPARKFQSALDHFLDSSRSSRDKAEDLLRDPEATAEALRKAAEKLLNREKAPAEADLDLAVQLCNRTLQVSDDDYDFILQLVLRHVAKAKRSELAVDLARAALRANVFRRQPVSDRSRWVLLETAMGALPSREAYHTIRRLYQHARTEQHNWRNRSSVGLWRRLFDSAVAEGHIWFASRLYADFQADGLQVPRACMLSYIHLVASRRSRSRSVLLERHIKDYMYDDAHPTEPLVIAFTQGLARTGPYDAASAVHMARRLDKTLPVRAVEEVVAPLTSSPDPSHQQLALRLLQDLPAAEASRSYQLVISSLVDTRRPFDLQLVLTLYKDMVHRGVPVTAQISSLITTALLKAGELDSALSVFNATADANLAIKSSAMGRLMVNLALAGRCDEAYAAEARWRGLFPNGADYDKGVRGARMLVDLKAGRDVDFAAFHGASEAKEEDYKMTRPYLRFLESVKEDMDGGGDIPATDKSSSVVAEVAEVEGRSEAKTTTNRTKSPQPGWIFDPQRGHGGDEGSGGGNVHMGMVGM